MLGGHSQKQHTQRWILPMLGTSSALVYGTIMLRLPLQANVLEARRITDYLVVDRWVLVGQVVLCMALLLCSYALGAAAVERSQYRKPAIVFFPLVFCGLLLFSFPLTSTDIYDYLFRGWMLAHHGVNPLVVPPAALAHDPLLPYVAWPNAVSAYGPLWERLSAAMAWFMAIRPGETTPDVVLFRLVLGYKLLGIIGYLLCGFAIWAALGSAGARWRWLGVYLWLWNPLVLWETIGAAHNDVWMALPVIGALWAARIWREHRPDLAQRLSPVFVLVALVAGGLIKFLAFFFGPLALAALLRETPVWRKRVRLVLVGGLSCLVLVVVAYWPLWAGLATLQSISDRRDLYTSSWLAALHPVLAEKLGWSSASSITSLIGLGLLVVGMFVCTWRVWQRPRRLEHEMLRLVLWFLLVCNPWFQPWYLIWLVALVAVLPWWRRMLWVVGTFCATAGLSYLVTSLVFPAWGLNQSAFVRELLTALFLYLPPIAVLFWPTLWRTRALTVASGSAIMPAESPRSSVDRATVS